MTCKLNERNDKTKKVIHLMVTSLCNRNCPHCCNKQYSLNDIPYVTDEELKEAEVLCITGGEPFLFTDPAKIARHYKFRYPNIKKVYVYTNAYELGSYLIKNQTDLALIGIDGLNVSIKLPVDKRYFETVIQLNKRVKRLPDNQLYVFDDIIPSELGNFKLIKREWQEDFKPADDSIFRKV